MTPTLDSIIASLPHASDCAVFTRRILGGLPIPTRERSGMECNCPRRDQVAYLERLKEPTRKMTDIIATGGDFTTNEAKLAIKDVLKAAEEKPMTDPIRELAEELAVNEVEGNPFFTERDDYEEIREESIKIAADRIANIIRAKLEAAVPENNDGHGYEAGWNDCRKAFLGGE